MQEEQRQQTAVPGGISTTTNGFFSTFDAAIVQCTIFEKWDLAAQNYLGTSNCGETPLSDYTRIEPNPPTTTPLLLPTIDGDSFICSIRVEETFGATAATRSGFVMEKEYLLVVVGGVVHQFQQQQQKQEGGGRLLPWFYDPAAFFNICFGISFPKCGDVWSFFTICSGLLLLCAVALNIISRNTSAAVRSATASASTNFRSARDGNVATHRGVSRLIGCLRGIVVSCGVVLRLVGGEWRLFGGSGAAGTVADSNYLRTLVESNASLEAVSILDTSIEKGGNDSFELLNTSLFTVYSRSPDSNELVCLRFFFVRPFGAQQQQQQQQQQGQHGTYKKGTTKCSEAEDDALRRTNAQIARVFLPVFEHTHACM